MGIGAYRIYLSIDLIGTVPIDRSIDEQAVCQSHRRPGGVLSPRSQDQLFGAEGLTMNDTEKVAETLCQLGIHALSRYEAKRMLLAGRVLRAWKDPLVFESEAVDVETALEKLGKANIPSALNAMIEDYCSGKKEEWGWLLRRHKRGAGVAPGEMDRKRDMERREIDHFYKMRMVEALHFGDRKPFEEALRLAEEAAGSPINEEDARKWCQGVRDEVDKKRKARKKKPDNSHNVKMWTRKQMEERKSEVTAQLLQAIVGEHKEDA